MAFILNGPPPTSRRTVVRWSFLTETNHYNYNYHYVYGVGEINTFIDSLKKTRGTALPRGSCLTVEAGTDPCEGGDRAAADDAPTAVRFGVAHPRASRREKEAADDRPTEAGDRSASQKLVLGGDPAARNGIAEQRQNQGRSEPISRKIWPVPHPGGIGLMRRYPLAHGPSPSTQVLGWSGSVSRHSRGLGSVGSATPGLREGHWDSSHVGCAFPSPQSPIAPPYYLAGGRLRSHSQ
jgi:hypothetical protein